MGCFLTCSVSSDRGGMGHVLAAMGVEDAEGEIRRAEEGGGSAPSAYAFMAPPHVRAYGDSYVATLAMARSSRGALMMLQDVMGRLPAGEYGIAYAFAWDYDPDLVSLNSDGRPYPGGGADAPECLLDVSERFMYSTVAQARVSRAGWCEEDMAEADLQRVAEAEALRCWAGLYHAGAI